MQVHEQVKPSRQSEIESANVKQLHEMRQEQIALQRVGGGDERRLRDIEGELQRRGEGVGVA